MSFAQTALSSLEGRRRSRRVNGLAMSLMTFGIGFALSAMAEVGYAAKHFHIFPTMADGNGWQSSLLVSNVERLTSHCTLQLYGMDVDRFADVGGVTAAGSTASFELPNGGDLVLTTRNGEATVSGYATLDCTEPVAAHIVLAWTESAGEATGMATVFSSRPAMVFRFPVLASAPPLSFAIANHRKVWDEPDSPLPPDAACRVVLEDTERMRLGASDFVVPANSSVVRSLDREVPIPAGFTRGSATMSCDLPVAVIGLRFGRHPDGTIMTLDTQSPAILSLSQLQPWFEGRWGDALITTRSVQPPPMEEESCTGMDDCASYYPMTADLTQVAAESGTEMPPERSGPAVVATVSGSVRIPLGAGEGFDWTVQGEVTSDGTLSLTSSDEPSVSDPESFGGEMTIRIASFEARADIEGVMTGRMTLHMSGDAVPGTVVMEGCLGKASLVWSFDLHRQSACIGWLSTDVE